MKTNLIHEKQTTGRDPRRVRQSFPQAASQKSIGSSRNNQTQTGPGDTKQGMGFSLMVFISPQGPKSNKPDIAVERDKVHSKPTRMALGPCGTTVAFDVSVSYRLLGAGALHDEYSLR